VRGLSHAGGAVLGAGGGDAAGGLEHHLDRDFAQAEHPVGVGAIGGVDHTIGFRARTARNADGGDRGGIGADGAPAIRTDRAEDADGRRAYRGAQMHNAGIVGDEQVTLREQRGHLCDGAERGGIDDAAGVAGDELVDQRLLEGLPGENDQEIG
jgi:hypothetical protein